MTALSEPCSCIFTISFVPEGNNGNKDTSDGSHYYYSTKETVPLSATTTKCASTAAAIDQTQRKTAKPKPLPRYARMRITFKRKETSLLHGSVVLFACLLACLLAGLLAGLLHDNYGQLESDWIRPGFVPVWRWRRRL